MDLRTFLASRLVRLYQSSQLSPEALLRPMMAEAMDTCATSRSFSAFLVKAAVSSAQETTGVTVRASQDAQARWAGSIWTEKHRAMQEETLPGTREPSVDLCFVVPPERNVRPKHHEARLTSTSHHGYTTQDDVTALTIRLRYGPNTLARLEMKTHRGKGPPHVCRHLDQALLRRCQQIDVIHPYYL